MSQYHYPVPLFESRLTVMVGEGEVPDIMRAHKVPPPGGFKAARAGVMEYPWPKGSVDAMTSRGGWLVVIHPEADIKLIAHESTHVAYYIAAWHHLALGEENEETVCYLVGWAAQCIQDAIDRYNGIV